LGKNIFSISFLILITLVFFPAFGQETEPETNGSAGETGDINFGTNAAIAANIATAGAFGFLAWQTWKLKKEREVTHRAWISDIDNEIFAYYYNEKKEQISPSKYYALSETEKVKFGEIKKTALSIAIKNFGKIPAFNVKARQKIVLSSPSKDQLPDRLGYPLVVMPNNKSNIEFAISQDDLKKIINGEQIYLIFEIHYYSAGSPKKEKIYGTIWKLGRRYRRLMTWDEKHSYEHEIDPFDED